MNSTGRQRQKWKAEADERARSRGDSSLLSLNTVLCSVGHVHLQLLMRDESVVRGVLEDADAYMHLCLSSVEIEQPLSRGGRPRRCELLQVKGNAIRAVHLPESVRGAAVMHSRLKAVDDGRRAFTKRVPKAVPQRPHGQAPLMSTLVSEADGDFVGDESDAVA